jgi:hypothetical protein
MELEYALREFQANSLTLESMSTLDQERKTSRPPELTISSKTCSEGDQITDQRLSSMMLSLIWEPSMELIVEERSPTLMFRSTRVTAVRPLTSSEMPSATHNSTLLNLSY